MEKTVNVSIKQKTISRLKEIGKSEDSIDDMINRLIDHFEITKEYDYTESEDQEDENEEDIECDRK